MLHPHRGCWRTGWVLAASAPAASTRGGYATEDGTGLHSLGTALHEAVSIRPGKRAWRAHSAPGGGYTEEAIQPRLI